MSNLKFNLLAGIMLVVMLPIFFVAFLIQCAMKSLTELLEGTND